MQLTKNRLRQIIKEELRRALTEQGRVEMDLEDVLVRSDLEPAAAPVRLGDNSTKYTKTLLFMTTSEANRGTPWEDSATKVFRDALGAEPTRITFDLQSDSRDGGFTVVRNSIQVAGIDAPTLAPHEVALKVALDKQVDVAERAGVELAEGTYFVETAVPASEGQYRDL